MFINIQGTQTMLCNAEVDRSIIQYLCKVAHAAQQAIGDTRRTAAAAGNFTSSICSYFNVQYLRRTKDDFFQGFRIVIFKARFNSKARKERSCKQTATRGSAYQCKRIQVDLDAAGIRTTVDHN